MAEITTTEVEKAADFCVKWILISIAVIILGALICAFTSGFAAFITGLLSVLGVISIVAGVIVLGIVKTGDIVEQNS